MNVGLIVANLPACRPVLDSLISRLSGSKGSSKDRTHGVTTSRGPGKSTDDYLELEERGNAGLETTIYSKRDHDSSSDLDVDDSESQKAIVGHSEHRNGLLRVQVKRDISVVTSPNEDLQR